MKQLLILISLTAFLALPGCKKDEPATEPMATKSSSTDKPNAAPSEPPPAEKPAQNPPVAKSETPPSAPHKANHQPVTPSYDIAGNWVGTDEIGQKVAMAFTKDGKVTTTATTAGVEIVMDEAYLLDGDQLTLTCKAAHVTKVPKDKEDKKAQIETAMQGAVGKTQTITATFKNKNTLSVGDASGKGMDLKRQ